MKQIIYKKIDTMNEALELLSIVSNNKAVEETEKNYSKKYNISKEELKRKVSLVLTMKKELSKKIKEEKDELDFYFKVETKDETSLASVVLLNSSMSEMKEIDEYFEELDRLGEEEYCKRFGEELLYLDRILFDETKELENECKNSIDVIKRLTKKDISLEKKWKLQQIFLEPDEHRKKLKKFIKMAKEVIDWHSSEIEQLVGEFYEFWSKMKPIEEYLLGKLGIMLDENAGGFIIIPAITELKRLSVIAHIENSVMTTPYYVKLGILVNEEMLLSSNGEEEKEDAEDIAGLLKLLSDKSKLEILSYIKDKKAYGSELAKHLGLTTATISHHMSALIEAHLVKIEKVDTRVYYMSNTETIEEILERCKGMLVNNK